MTRGLYRVWWVLVARGDHFVGLLESGSHWLFEEDARPGLGAGDDHVPVLVEEAVGDGDDLWLLFRQHLSVVGVGLRGFETLGGGAPTGLVLVGDGHDLSPVIVQPDGVKSVPVIALASPANDGDAVGLHGGPPVAGPHHRTRCGPPQFPTARLNRRGKPATIPLAPASQP